jgi:hypothetical protein
MLLDADKPVATAPPTDWRWPSQWPSAAQAALLLLAWGLSLLSRVFHPYLDHVVYGLVSVWFFWLCWDVAVNPSNPRQLGRSKTRRTADAMVGIALWLGVTLWYYWPSSTAQ